MSDKLRQQDLFLAALLVQPTVLAAAKVAGVSQATATRWLASASFQAKHAAARKRAVSEAIAHLQSILLTAVQEVHAVLLSDDSTSTVKLQAARTLLEYSFKSIELENVETKMDKILHGLEELRSHAAL
jgi:hypothetical protein